MKKFAILGIHPELSITELKTVIKNKVDQSSEQAAIFVSSMNFQELQNTLGGTQKLGEIIGTVKDHQEIEKHLKAILLDQESDGKLKFGISVYDLGNPKLTKEIQKYMLKTGISIKKTVKETGKSIRLVTSKEPILSTVVVQKNKLTTKGIEFVLLVDESEIHIGITKTIQDFEDWSHRDYDRPARDAKSGMLPPKLARIMMNLSGVNPKESALLDPFCGSGTVLMEASLLGFRNLTGSDISTKAVKDTRKNLEWLRNENYPVSKFELFKSSASELDNHLKEKTFDVIVAEPFLGKPRQGTESENQIQKNIQELNKLYKENFETLVNLLKSDGTIVVVAPIHFLENKKFETDLRKILQNLGLKQKSNNKKLIYKRKDQFIGREILVFSF